MTTPTEGVVKPLVIVGQTNTTADVVSSNLEATFERGYTPLVEVKEYRGPVSIVGAGPSLSSTYQDVVGDVVACNSAHDFLIEKGIIPKYAMVWDAHPIMGKIITKPHKDVTYLIASRCHPSVFAALEGHKVMVWHALGGDDGLERMLIKHNRMEPMIAGGSSSVTRATHVVGALGYTKEMHLFGVDSCYAEDKTHVGGSLIDQQKMAIRVCGRWFTVAPWMAMQAGDFKVLAPLLKANGMRLVVHGTGLIPYVATFLDVEAPDVKVTWYERVRREVHAAVLLFLEVRNSPQLLGGSHAGV
mgnify:CR=1 FL=1